MWLYNWFFKLVEDDLMSLLQSQINEQENDDVEIILFGSMST